MDKKHQISLLSAIIVIFFTSPAWNETIQVKECKKDVSSNVGEEKTTSLIKTLHLRRRNWENNGTDTYITGNGHYQVFVYAQGSSKQIREGVLDKEALKTLANSFSKINFFTLPYEYKAPFKNQYSWWGYELTLEIDNGTKTVRYHSEDANVPNQLTDIVKQLMELTK